MRDDSAPDGPNGHANGFYAAYKTDTDLEEDGIWVTDFPGGAEVRIRSALSSRAKTVQREVQRRHRHAFQQAHKRGDDLPEAVVHDIDAEWAAHGLVADWRGVTGRDGAEMPFAPEAARALFDELPHFLADVVMAATQRAAYLEREREDDLGN